MPLAGRLRGKLTRRATKAMQVAHVVTDFVATKAVE
jgi:hypothetical protein